MNDSHDSNDLNTTLLKCCYIMDGKLLKEKREESDSIEVQKLYIFNKFHINPKLPF